MAGQQRVVGHNVEVAHVAVVRYVASPHYQIPVPHLPTPRAHQHPPQSTTPLKGPTFTKLLHTATGPKVGNWCRPSVPLLVFISVFRNFAILVNKPIA